MLQFIIRVSSKSLELYSSLYLDIFQKVGIRLKNIFFKREFNQKGVAIVEFCICCGLFFMLTITGAETLIMMYKSITLQFATSRAARDAIVGPVDHSTGKLPTTGYNPTDYAGKINVGLKDEAKKYVITLTDSDISICPVAELNGFNCSTHSTGNPGVLMMIRSSIPYKLMLLPITVNLSGTAIGKMQRF